MEWIHVCYILFVDFVAQERNCHTRGCFFLNACVNFLWYTIITAFSKVRHAADEELFRPTLKIGKDAILVRLWLIHALSRPDLWYTFSFLSMFDWCWQHKCNTKDNLYCPTFPWRHLIVFTQHNNILIQAETQSKNC